MKKTKEKPKRAIASGVDSSRRSLKNRRQKMNSERTLDITTEHVESAITHYLQSMRLIDQDELITAFVPVGVGTVRISLKKEVLN